MLLELDLYLTLLAWLFLKLTCYVDLSTILGAKGRCRSNGFSGILMLLLHFWGLSPLLSLAKRTLKTLSFSSQLMEEISILSVGVIFRFILALERAAVPGLEPLVYPGNLLLRVMLGLNFYCCFLTSRIAWIKNSSISERWSRIMVDSFLMLEFSFYCQFSCCFVFYSSASILRIYWP